MDVALYIDLDNMLGYCYSLGYEFNPSVLIKEIEKSGWYKVTIARSYGSIRSALAHLNNFLSEEEIHSRLAKAGIVHTCCTGKKNTADLELSLDAWSRKDEYGALFLVSSDSDFESIAVRLENSGKAVQYIKMFKTREDDTSLFYPELLGIKSETGVDALALIYRNTLEQILKTSLADPITLGMVAAQVESLFKYGMSVAELAKEVDAKLKSQNSTCTPFRIIRTAFFGRAFVSDPDEKCRLFAIKGDNVQRSFCSAYYRQCEYLLRRKLRMKINSQALNKCFMLNGNEHYSLESRRLETV